MSKEALRYTLLSFFGYALLSAYLFAITLLLVTYEPDVHKTSGKIGISTIVLNAAVWSLLFTIAGSFSLLNLRAQVRKRFILSFLSFLFGPFLLCFIVMVSTNTRYLFGFSETAFAYLIAQNFFFFKFRSLLRVQTRKDFVNNNTDGSS